MEPTPPPDTQYLERHGRKWRVSVGVPDRLKHILGHRLKRTLDTESLEAANVLKPRIIAEFKARIAAARKAEAASREVRARLAEAVALHAELATTADDEDFDTVSKAILDRIEALKHELATGVRLVDFEDGEPPEELPDLPPEAVKEVEAYRAVAIGGQVPIDFHQRTYKDWLRDFKPWIPHQPKSPAILIAWLRQRGVEPFVRNVTAGLAAEFVAEMPAFTGVAWAANARHLNGITGYWDWLVAEGHADENPFADLSIGKPSL